ncbi:hypothetical protein ACHAW6_011148 [Cyclotella cf. meneghiniana]
MKRPHSLILGPRTHCFTLLLLCWTSLLLAFTPYSSCSFHHHYHHHHHDDMPTSFSNCNSKRKALTPLFFSAIHQTTNNSTHPKVTGVTLKMAFDSSPAWGVAESSPTTPQRFTSPPSLDMVHRLRRESCAVLVGRATVERDDCSLTVRRVEMEEGAAQPVRVVLDPELKLIERDFALLRDGLPTLVYHRAECDRDDEMQRRERVGAVTFVEMKHRANDQQYALCPAEIIRDLESRGLHHIMVEGGPTTARLFLNARLVDRAILVRAPIRFQEPLSAGFDEETLKNAGLTFIGKSMMGGDTVEYWTKGGRDWPAPQFFLWP